MAATAWLKGGFCGLLFPIANDKDNGYTDHAKLIDVTVVYGFRTDTVVVVSSKGRPSLTVELYFFFEATHTRRVGRTKRSRRRSRQMREDDHSTPLECTRVSDAHWRVSRNCSGVSIATCTHLHCLCLSLLPPQSLPAVTHSRSTRRLQRLPCRRWSGVRLTSPCSAVRWLHRVSSTSPLARPSDGESHLHDCLCCCCCWLSAPGASQRTLRVLHVRTARPCPPATRSSAAHRSNMHWRPIRAAPGLSAPSVDSIAICARTQTAAAVTQTMIAHTMPHAVPCAWLQAHRAALRRTAAARIRDVTACPPAPRLRMVQTHSCCFSDSSSPRLDSYSRCCAAAKGRARGAA